MPRNYTGTEKIFFGVIIFLVIIILICVCVAFFIIGTNHSKIALYAVITIFILIFIAIISFTEWFRRKSIKRRDNINTIESLKTPPLIRKNRIQKNSWEKKRLSERSSWISWFPKKSSGNIKPSAPYETDV